VIVLNATTDSLELTTSAAVSTDYHVSFATVDATSLTFVPSSNSANVATATTTTIVSAPSAGTVRQVKFASVRNRSTTTAQTITVKVDVSTTEYHVFAATLQPGDTAVFTDAQGWCVLTSSGRKRVASPQQDIISGRVAEYQKIGTVFEAAGSLYCYSKDIGFPGPWAPGTPGLAGRVTDGTAVADAGCLNYVNAASGANYLSGWNGSATVGGKQMILDVLWVQTALVVTTTTIQTINSVAFPARDVVGAVNGEGCLVGILVTAATTNGGAITNTVLTYTNSAGTGSRTATIASFPATAVVGTVVFFELQAGDTGVQSIQSIVLGTSYGGGSISLFVARRLAGLAQTLANTGGNAPIDAAGVRLYDGTCMLLFALGSATTATNISGEVYVTNR
jgi:hypothetical protein